MRFTLLDGHGNVVVFPLKFISHTTYPPHNPWTLSVILCNIRFSKQGAGHGQGLGERNTIISSCIVLNREFLDRLLTDERDDSTPA